MRVHGPYRKVVAEKHRLGRGKATQPNERQELLTKKLAACSKSADVSAIPVRSAALILETGR
jgi:hypothetical protein